MRRAAAAGRRLPARVARRAPAAGHLRDPARRHDHLADALGASASLRGGGPADRVPGPIAGTRRGGDRGAVRGRVSARFDAVLIAATAPVAASLLDGELPAASRALGAIPHGTSLLVTLAYPRERVGRHLVGHGYLVPPAEGGPIAACTWTSEKWPNRAPDDAVMCRVFVRDEDAWTSLPDAELVAAARADVERTLGISSERCSCASRATPAPCPRYTGGTSPPRGRRSSMPWPRGPPVTLAGASYRGVGLPVLRDAGLAAAAAVGEWLGAPPEGAQEKAPEGALEPAGAA